jgi:hypothetical protein
LLAKEWTAEPDGAMVSKLLEATGKKLGDTLTIKRFVRYQLGA